LATKGVFTGTLPSPVPGEYETTVGPVCAIIRAGMETTIAASLTLRTILTAASKMLFTVWARLMSPYLVQKEIDSNITKNVSPGHGHRYH
jgi:hypothetical protein